MVGTCGRSRLKKTLDEVMRKDLSVLGLTDEIIRDEKMRQFAVPEKICQAK